MTDYKIIIHYRDDKQPIYYSGFDTEEAAMASYKFCCDTYRYNEKISGVQIVNIISEEIFP